jgi:hypothetical protein
MMRKLIPCFVVFMFSLSLSAQEVENALEQIQITDSSSHSAQPLKTPDKKLKVGVDVGMGYMFSSSGFGGPQFSISPHVTYPLSDKFWLNAGISAGINQYYMPYSASEGINYQMFPMTQLFLYASGNYRVSNKLVLTGSVYRQYLINPQDNRQSIISNYVNNGMSVGFNYKIGSNVTVGAQVHIQSNNNNPYYPGNISNAGGIYNPYGW